MKEKPYFFFWNVERINIYKEVKTDATRSSSVQHDVPDEINTGKLGIEGPAMQDSATVAGVVEEKTGSLL